MGFGSWLKRHHRGKEAAPKRDLLSEVHWVPESENVFGVELLDCRTFSQSMLSVTEDPEVAETFVTLRDSRGDHYRGRAVEDPRTCGCDLRYPNRGETRDGPIFKAKTMEDKWDIYLFDGHLYFARSWTGELRYRARVVFDGEWAAVVGIEAPRALFESDPDYHVAAVDYLIRSHLYRLPVPHPLPKSLGRDPRQLALFSFSQHGRYGLYGTFADTTRLRPPGREEPAGEPEA